jgi:hypothetical protein
MGLSEQLLRHVRAASAGIWVVSREPHEVEEEAIRLSGEQGWGCHTWDVSRGLRPIQDMDRVGTRMSPRDAAGAAFDPAIQHEKASLVLLHNFHRFLADPATLQALVNGIQAGKRTGVFSLVLAPTGAIPPELATYVQLLEHEPPTRDELRRLLNNLLEKPEDGEVPDNILAAASGMTRYEAEAAFADCIANDGRVSATTVWRKKAESLRKEGALEVYKGAEGLDSVAGLRQVKELAVRLFRPREKPTVGRAKGLLFLGVPGVGKTAVAKAVGNELGIPTVIGSIDALLSKYVGDSEANLRRVIRQVEAMSPCIWFFDEFEKSTSGQGQDNDAGVMTRIVGELLRWRQDSTAPVYTIMTCNDVSKLPAPLLRQGRLNATLFFDFPTREEKDGIWSLYLKTFAIDTDQPMPDDTDWTGAEVKGCCETAELLGVPLGEASRYVVPIAKTRGPELDELRAWADGRVLSASLPGIYSRGKKAGSRPEKRRNIRPAGDSMN